VSLRRDPLKEEYGTALGAYGCLAGGVTAKADRVRRGRAAIAQWDLCHGGRRLNPWNGVPWCPANIRMIADTVPIYLTGRALGDPHVRATTFQPKYDDNVASFCWVQIGWETRVFLHVANPAL